MTLPRVINPFDDYIGLAGNELNSGSLFIGVAGSDPESSPQACYWDAAGAVPAAQPIPIFGGYTMRAGTPARVYTAKTYSMRLRDISGAQVFYEANASPDVLTAAGLDYLQAGTGAVTQTVQKRLRWSVYVTDFGAVGDGSADDTAAIQRAIDYAASIGGARVLFPAGSFKILGTLNITSNGISLVGYNRFSSKLVFANGALDCIVARGVSQANSIYGFQLENIYLDHTGKTGGRTLYLAFASRAYIRNVAVGNCWTGFEVYVTNDVFMENIILQGVLGGAGAYGLYWHAPGDGSGRSDQLTLIGFTINALYSGADGFVWDGAATTFNGSYITALDCRYGMWVKNTSGSNTNYPQLGEFNNFNSDGMSAVGLRIEAGAEMQFTNAQINNTSGSSGQGSADTYALEILPDTGASMTRSFQFTNCRIGLSKQSAASISGRDIQFSLCKFAAGSTTPANTYPALHILAPSQDITIVGCGSEIFGNPNDWACGVQVDAGTFRINNFANNWALATRDSIWNSSDTQSRSGGNISSAPASVDIAPMTFPSAGTADPGAVLTVAHLLGGILQTSGAGAAFANVTPTAALIVAGFQSAQPGKTAMLHMLNGNNFAWTLQPGAGVSMAGLATGANHVIASQSSRLLHLRLDNTTAGSEAVTIFG